MTLSPIVPVILSGGSGTRLWPLSRASYPKQFAPLIGADSLFQASVLRLARPGFAAPLVVTTDDFRFIVTEQMAARRIDPGAVLIEPAGRDTAAAVLAATLQAAQDDPRTLVLIAPSDHLIPDADSFATCVMAARAAAEAGRIVTFGIPPTRPETGYGYLDPEPEPDDASSRTGPLPRPLRHFVEKPDAATARAMLDEGHHLWNAGLFLFRADVMRAAFETHAPETLSQVETALAQARCDLGFIRLAPEPWTAIDPISIDYAVMEKADNLSVMPYDGAWSDLGDWAAVWRETESCGLATQGATLAMDCADTLLRSENDRQAIVGIGLEGIVAIAMPDAVLVVRKDRAQDVKQAVARLHADGHGQARTLPRDYRPWGWYESLTQGPRFQVKRIVVHPGAALSLQSHHHRSEHWIVVEGTARVTIDETVRLITENQSVYIPLGTRHRLENPGKLPTVLIEVQTGAYLGEDDIQRFEDVYART